MCVVQMQNGSLDNSGASAEHASVAIGRENRWCGQKVDVIGMKAGSRSIGELSADFVVADLHWCVQEPPLRWNA